MISITENDYEAILEVCREGAVVGRLDPSILEKDVLITQVLGLLQRFNWDEFSIVFCGGTSLSKGYRLIDRMSEDIDFKIVVPPCLTRSQSRKRLGKLHRSLSQYLNGLEFELNTPAPKNENRYFHFSLGYASRFRKLLALRPGIELDFTANTRRRPSRGVEVRSMLSELVPDRQESPVLYQALDYKETVVEKVVAFLRRTARWEKENEPNQQRKEEDKRLVRHLYDVQQLLQKKPDIKDEIVDLRVLFKEIIKTDQNQDKEFAKNAIQILNNSLNYLSDPLSDFEELYEDFVNDLVWGQAVEFIEAREAFNELACQLLNN